MRVKTSIHEKDDIQIAEITHSGLLVVTPQDALEVMMSIGTAGIRKIIFHQKNFAPEFFDLKSGLAGEVLQKASNYKMQIAIVGQFDAIQSSSMKAFIAESNRGRQNFFVGDVDSAVKMLAERHIK